MKAKIHVNNEFFLYLELHKMANKNHHYRSRETAEERKKFYIIVTLTVLSFFLLFEQGPPHFNFALGPANYVAISVLSCPLFKVGHELRMTWNTLNNYT